MNTFREVWWRVGVCFGSDRRVLLAIRNALEFFFFEGSGRRMEVCRGMFGGADRFMSVRE